MRAQCNHFQVWLTMLLLLLSLLVVAAVLLWRRRRSASSLSASVDLNEPNWEKDKVYLVQIPCAPKVHTYVLAYT